MSNLPSIAYTERERAEIKGRIKALEAAGPGGGGAVAWDAVTSKPTTFPPATHGHVIADTTGLQAALDGKQSALVSATTLKTVNGNSLLGSGDLAISGGGGVSGAGVITLPTARYEHEETIAAVGVTLENRINVWLAPGLDTDENTSDMTDLQSISAVPGNAQITVLAAFSQLMRGPLKIQWSAS